MADDSVEVIVQIAGEDVPAGRVWAHHGRGAQSATFAYHDAYLQRSDAYALDPALALTSGQQQTPEGRALFGAFSDVARRAGAGVFCVAASSSRPANTTETSARGSRLEVQAIHRSCLGQPALAARHLIRVW